MGQEKPAQHRHESVGSRTVVRGGMGEEMEALRV